MVDRLRLPRHCEACGLRLQATDEHSIETILPKRNTGRAYTLGDTIVLPDSAVSIRRSGFRAGLRELERLDDLWFLLLWQCPECGADNGLSLRILESVLVAAESATLGRAALCRAHFLDQEIGNGEVQRIYRRVYPDEDGDIVELMQLEWMLEDLCEGR
ncbi:hypothetical protein PPSIR1_27598 [Plesiocystis pacifica SIR-1]|uniref:Uncharacterized protein n=2 Tax=Plesiocystis pacifica TaxID=191768 RepID=A6G4T4_9BACT|nr:hypothetical protein PPSIR1_27598 [Plesiocystis pacifica SIR-1]